MMARGLRLSLLFMASLIAVYFFVNFEKALLISVFNELQTEFGIAAGAVAGVSSVFTLAYAAMQPVTGVLVDRYGGVRVLRTGVLFFAAGSLLFPLSRSPETLYLARALTGIGAGTAYLGIVKEIDRLFPGAFTKILGVTMLTGYVGTGFAGLPVVWAVRRFGWRSVAGGIGVFIAAAALVMLRLSRGIEKPPVKSAGRWFSLQPYLRALRNRELRRMLGASPPMYAAFFVMLNALAVKMLEDVGGFSSRSAGAVFSVMVGLSAAVPLVPGLLENLLGGRRKKLFLIQLATAWSGLALTAAGVLFGGNAALLVSGLWMLAAAGGGTPLTVGIFRGIGGPGDLGVVLCLSNCTVHLLTSFFAQASGMLLDFFGRGGAVRSETAVIYPPGAYLAVLTLLLAAVSLALWNGCRVSETGDRGLGRRD